MRGVLLFTVLSLMCLLHDAQGECNFQGQVLSVGVHTVNCARFTCHADGSVSGVACPVMACREEIGYQETDLSKPYPDCCARPICKETS